MTSALEKWQGTWVLETEHFSGELTVSEFYSGAENDNISGTVKFNKKNTDQQQYRFHCSIALSQIENDEIEVMGSGPRSSDESTFSIYMMLVRYQSPVGSTNRAVGYFQLGATARRPSGVKLPVESVKR